MRVGSYLVTSPLRERRGVRDVYLNTVNLIIIFLK